MADNDLNDVIEETVDDAAVITVPIDATLSNSGEAADAKAVGDALALKADADAVVNVSVNGQQADNQGAILIDGRHIPVSDSDTTKLNAKIAALDGKTGADIPLTGQTGSQTIAQAFNENVNKTAENIQMSSSDTQTVAEAIGQLQDMADGVVLSVNGETPDGMGNVAVEEVAFARNLTAESAQATTGTFVNRMAGGTVSIADGDAFIQQIRGVNVHTGIVQESLTWEVDAPRQEEEEGITVSINRATFVSYVDESGTITMVYDGSDWKVDGTAVTLSDYGVTVTGTAVSGDEIEIVYVKASRGLISVATPTSFNATGWNLYNNTTGYARVFKYDHGYKVSGSGTYTMLQFSATISGTKTTITPVDGDFDIPSDGYVWVTGGNLTSTYITPTHTDWTEGPDVPFTTYSLNTIDLTALGDLFEDGMCAVGGTYDVIDFELGMAIKKIEKLEYSDETIAALILAGREYDADEDYIYAVMASADWETEDLSSDGVYTVSDHGLEWFDGTDVGPYCAILYGQNLKDKLASDVVTISAQNLTPNQQKQIRQNVKSGGAITVDCGTITALPATVTDDRITDKMKVRGWAFGTEANATLPWTVVTANGSLTITGTVSTTGTTLSLDLNEYW